MKKIDLNPTPKKLPPNFPIHIEYRSWDITIDLYLGKYHFIGSMQWDVSNVRAITRAYSKESNLTKCLNEFKSVLDNEVRRKSK